MTVPSSSRRSARKKKRRLSQGGGAGAAEAPGRPGSEFAQAARPALRLADVGGVEAGLGRIVALHCHSSTSYQIF